MACSSRVHQQSLDHQTVSGAAEAVRAYGIGERVRCPREGRISAPGSFTRLPKVRWGVVRLVLAVVVTILCLTYFGAEVARYSDSVTKLRWTPQLSALMTVALILQVGSSLLDAWSWGWLLRAFQVPTTMRHSLAIFGMAQFAKYLPGNIVQHIGRVVLARRAGWHTERVALSVLIENVFALGAGGLMAIAGFMVSGGRLDNGSRLFVTAVVVTLGWMVAAISVRVALANPPAFLKRWLALDSPLQMRSHVFALYFGVHLISFAAMGCTLAILLWGLAGSWPIGIWRVPAGVALAWLAGYVVPGAPAGIGIREAVLTAFLSPHIEAGIVVSAALLWRVVSLAADGALLAALGFSFVRPRAANEPDNAFGQVPMRWSPEGFHPCGSLDKIFAAFAFRLLCPGLPGVSDPGQGMRVRRQR